jgi:hypothetical protein
MTICFRSSPIHSHLFKVKEKSSYSTSLTEYHRLSRFAREMGASPSLDRVMVLTYIKFTKEFNTYDQKPPLPEFLSTHPTLRHESKISKPMLRSR